MASIDKPTSTQAPPPHPSSRRGCFFMDAVLRFSVFATAAAAVILMVTSNQTELVPYPLNPLIRVPVRAKFSHSPAFIYFIAALSVASLYSIITMLASFCASCKPVYKTKFLLHVALFDVVVLGLVASATGTAGGVAYIGLKGNSHVNWGKICNIYDSFCRHLGISIALSLAASVLLVFLVWRSISSLHSKINRY